MVTFERLGTGRLLLLIVMQTIPLYQERDRWTEFSRIVLSKIEQYVCPGPDRKNSFLP